jgi:hypothetical protein
MRRDRCTMRPVKASYQFSLIRSSCLRAIGAIGLIAIECNPMNTSNLPAITFPDPLERPQLRRAVYGILITIAIGNMVGRILAVNSVDMIRLEQNLIDREVRSRLDKQAASLKAAGTPFDREMLAKEIRAEVSDDSRMRKQRPFLSANDRSRWTTIRALVEHGTYAIDDIIAEPNWDTIDMVKHKDAEGNWHLYSSKPPLLATLYAAPYWVVYQIANAFGDETDAETAPAITLGTHPYEIGRGLLILFNVVPMVIYFLLLGRLLDRLGTTDWGPIFIMAAAVLGTFLTTFAITLNNHLPAAVSTLVTLWAAARIWYDGEQCPCYFIFAGFFAAFAVACELPALALLGLVGAALLWKHPKPTLLFGLPAAAVVFAAYFGTNYIAHGTIKLPYAHRGDGALLFERFVADIDKAIDTLNAGRLPDELREQFNEEGISLSSDFRVRSKHEHLASGDQRRWIIEDRQQNESYSVRAGPGPDADAAIGAGSLLVHEFDDWYDYEYTRASDGRVIQSYWRTPAGIDKGEAELGKYALHSLVGHHGIFSLTPVWLLIFPGVVLLCSIERGYGYRALAALVAIITLICVAFYILRPPLDRNYGGMTSGFRWVFWLAPLWLLGALPAADWLAARRWGRGLAYVLLALSVISVVYPTWNPWTYPWLTNFWLYMGWEEF